MIKKYEIITVGADKRIKALRSFSVQGRYVNVGDVGGIVYDENTLSQEGNAWIFSGNLGYPSIRVGGDSIVDTNGYEGAVTDPRPFVNITGTSALIGAHEFVTGKVSASKVLAVGDVEQGNVTAVIGSKYNESKVPDANTLRTKVAYYNGMGPLTIAVAGGGYEAKVLTYDRDGKITYESAFSTRVNATDKNAYYYAVVIRKTPTAATVPADIVAANVTIPSTVIESTINIKDSRIEFNYTSAMTVATKVNPGASGSNTAPVSNISESNVVISKKGAGAYVANIFADVIKCNVEFTATSTASLLIGDFRNVGRLIADGSTAYASSLAVRGALKVYDCYDFAFKAAVLSTGAYNDAIAAQMPFTFIRCNVPVGNFRHNAIAKNTYVDIDFSRASADLGKVFNSITLHSSEVEGMYRLYHVSSNAPGALVESYDSVKSANFSRVGTMSATTIYKDATFTGLFDIAGTNVFGGTGKHGGGKGCEITNTKETAMVISGNVRVEGNAKVKDTRITGTGYFGGNSVTENAYIFGSAYVTDNGVFSPAPEEGKFDSDIHIEDNAKFLATSRAGNTVVYMCGDSEFSGTIAFNTVSLAMYGKSRIAGKVSGRGVLILEDNADTSDKNVEAYGCIRLVGNYRQTEEKIWTGRRTISSESEPTYENNVKTKYDF
jgi:hypothetical protein|nr:MAG TPA: Putative transferase, nesg, ydcK, Structural Genomics.38A [Caudoviricetes sp.]